MPEARGCCHSTRPARASKPFTVPSSRTAGRPRGQLDATAQREPRLPDGPPRHEVPADQIPAARRAGRIRTQGRCKGCLVDSSHRVARGLIQRRRPRDVQQPGRREIVRPPPPRTRHADAARGAASTAAVAGSILAPAVRRRHSCHRIGRDRYPRLAETSMRKPALRSIASMQAALGIHQFVGSPAKLCSTNCNRGAASSWKIALSSNG